MSLTRLKIRRSRRDTIAPNEIATRLNDEGNRSSRCQSFEVSPLWHFTV